MYKSVNFTDLFLIKIIWIYTFLNLFLFFYVINKNKTHLDFFYACVIY